MLRGVAAGDVRLGHRERGADLAGEQRLEPLLLLLGRAEHVQDLHVAGVRRGAVQRLGGDLGRPARTARPAGRSRGRVRPWAGSVLSGRNRFHRPAARAWALRSSTTCGSSCGPARRGQLAALRGVDRLGGEHGVVHEGLQPREVLLRAGAVLEVHRVLRPSGRRPRRRRWAPAHRACGWYVGIVPPPVSPPRGGPMAPDLPLDLDRARRPRDRWGVRDRGRGVPPAGRAPGRAWSCATSTSPGRRRWPQEIGGAARCAAT